MPKKQNNRGITPVRKLEQDGSTTDQYTSNSRSYGNANQQAQREQDRLQNEGNQAENKGIPARSLKPETDWDDSSDYNQPGGGRSPTKDENQQPRKKREDEHHTGSY